jgi:tryptophanyl-tRNA synthetase
VKLLIIEIKKRGRNKTTGRLTQGYEGQTVKNMRFLTILSGFQPSGKLHLGNYFGAIKPLLEFQKGQKNVYCLIADYHSITSSHDSAILKQNIENMAIELRALGIENIFFQSAIPEILELYWILSSVIPVSYLERCHAYKDKISKGQTPSLALFSYPILMAAGYEHRH